MGRRRGRGRKKRKGLFHRYKKGWFLGIVIVSILLASLFFIAIGRKTTYTPFAPKRITKEVLEKRLKELDNAVGRSLSSLGVKKRGLREPLSITEIGGELFVTPYREDFILPEGLASKGIEEDLPQLLRIPDYEVKIAFEEREDHLLGRVFLDGYPSHLLYLYYPPPKPKGMIAIVIDDIGYDMKTARELIGMDASITLSILPHLPYSIQIAKEAKDKGRDILLHLPMEAKDPKQNPGEGSLFTTMSPEEVRGIVKSDLRAVPYIIGVNNHMGSRFSEDEGRMRVVLEGIKEEGFFFLDSKTSKDSKGYLLAKEMGIKAMARDVFLDNEKDVGYIKGQLAKLLDIAKKRGYAIAIGHPHPETVTAIKEMLPVLKRDGIEVVPLSSLIDMGVEDRKALHSKSSQYKN